MSVTYEYGRVALDGLAERVAEQDTLDRNEATTRLQLIDQLLFEVLGWSRDETVSEERYDGTYSDYSLGRPRRLIVEAKREGIAFELPVGQKSGVVLIRTLMDEPEIRAALEQVLAYGQERGVPFVAVANGHQLIALVASRQDGTPPLEGRALVFTSLEDMRANFRVLWDNLSREGIGLQRLQVTLRDVSLPAPPPKLAQRLPGYPRFRVRNHLQTDLQILGDLFMEDVFRSDSSEEEQFLKACYSPSGALSQYALISKEILRTRYSALVAEEGGVSIEPATDPDSKFINPELLSTALARRPIVLLGDVGVGKTMFIRNLVNVEARDLFGDAITLYVDFLAEPAVRADLGGHVSRSIERQLLEQYDVDVTEENFVVAVYHGDLKRFDKSILGRLKEVDPPSYERERIRFLADKMADLEGHLKASLDHIVKGRRKQIVVFLDNIDQRPSEFQEQVYVMAHAMAETWPVATFVSLRPSTFFASKRRGSLAAYQPRVFSIAPPRIDRVLIRRISYVLDRLQNSGELDALPGSKLELGSLTTYLGTLLHSLQHNEELVELIDNLSGGNVRRALEFVQTFIGSGNVDTEKILERTDKVGVFVIEVHQFLRAILLGDMQDFDAEASPISNIFDLLTPDGREHFILPLVLSEIRRLGDVGGEEGYVQASAVYDFGQRLGFMPHQIAWCLDRSAQHDLLELRPLSSDLSEAMYRITSVGSYSVQRLPRMFAYLDAVVVDTPIVDPAMRAQISDATYIGDRLARAEVFRLYLDSQWNGFTDLAETFDWADVSSAARDDIWSLGRRFADWP